MGARSLRTSLAPGTGQQPPGIENQRAIVTQFSERCPLQHLYGDHRGPRTQVGDTGGEKDTGFFAFSFRPRRLGEGSWPEGRELRKMGARAGGTSPKRVANV